MGLDELTSYKWLGNREWAGANLTHEISSKVIFALCVCGFYENNAFCFGRMKAPIGDMSPRWF